MTLFFLFLHAHEVGGGVLQLEREGCLVNLQFKCSVNNLTKGTTATCFLSRLKTQGFTHCSVSHLLQKKKKKKILQGFCSHQWCVLCTYCNGSMCSIKWSCCWRIVSLELLCCPTLVQASEYLACPVVTYQPKQHPCALFPCSDWLVMLCIR